MQCRTNDYECFSSLSLLGATAMIIHVNVWRQWGTAIVMPNTNEQAIERTVQDKSYREKKKTWKGLGDRQVSTDIQCTGAWNALLHTSLTCCLSPVVVILSNGRDGLTWIWIWTWLEISWTSSELFWERNSLFSSRSHTHRMKCYDCFFPRPSGGRTLFVCVSSGMPF